MKKNNFLISIIIPYHGNNKQVQNLLDTIPDKQEIEVLLINDVIDSKPLGYSKFTKTKLIELYNIPPAKWAGASRNTGLRQCSGSFVIFADSDDTLITDDFLLLLDKLKTIEVFDYAICPVTSIIAGTDQMGTRHLKYETGINKFAKSGDKRSFFPQYTPWAKVYTRDFLRKNKILFEEVEASNDVVFSLKCWIFSQKVIYIDVLFYVVTESKDSLTQITTKQRAISRFREFIKYNDILQKHNYKENKSNMAWFLKEIRKHSFWSYYYYSFISIYKGHSFSYELPSNASRKKQIWFILKVLSKRTKTYSLLKPIVKKKRDVNLKSKKKVFIFANCHGNIYKNALLKADKRSVLNIDHVISYENIDNFEKIKHKFSECDILIIQPIQNYDKWKMENLLPLLKKDCTVIRIPFIRFNGYWDKNSVRDLKKFKQPAVMFFPNIKEMNEVLKYIEGNLLDKSQITENFKLAVNELKKLEKQGDIKFVDFIINNHQFIPLFRDAYHPTKIMYDFITHQLIESVRNRVPSLLQDHFSIPKEWRKEWGHFKPIDNKTASILGLEYDLDSYFKYTRSKYLKAILYYENQVNIKTINDLSDLNNLLSSFDEHTFEKDHVLSSSNNCIAYDKEWQFPAITEQHAYRMLCNNQSVYQNDSIYVAFPWATLIDLINKKMDEFTILLEVLTQIKKEVVGRKNIITVCQHIDMLRYQDLFIAVGITDIFWSHAIKGQYTLPNAQNIKIHPFPLYPVQFNETNQATYKKEYLYSFVGSRSNKGYLTKSRDFIIDILSKDTRGYIIGREQWHYQNIVYKHQIKKELDFDTNLVDNSSSAEFQDIVKKSIFSLCPSGSGPNSIRLWESIGLGSIPVILADTYLPPGDLELWSEAVVYCEETEEAIHKLPNLLEELAKDKSLLAKKRAAMKKLWTIYGPDNFVKDVKDLLFLDS